MRGFEGTTDEELHDALAPLDHNVLALALLRRNGQYSDLDSPNRRCGTYSGGPWVRGRGGRGLVGGRNQKTYHMVLMHSE